MVDPNGIGRAPTYEYDGSPYSGLPLFARPAGDPGGRAPRWPGLPRWPRRRRRRASQRRFKLTWPYPGRKLGDALVFLTSADGSLIGSKHERHRYATVGVLMIITAAQAFYAATLFFSVSLSKPFRSEIFFGVFFAVAVVLIDRSIISYAAPVRLDKDGNLRPPRKTNGVLFIRVAIAIVAAILMSEMILLQVFAGDIRQQIQNNHLAATQTTNAQIEANYQARIGVLRTQIDQAQATVSTDQGIVNSDQGAVNKATQAMNCQEFGCPGITAGLGPGFRAAEKTLQGAQQTLQLDQQKLGNAQARLKDVSTANLNQISTLNTEEQQAIASAQPAITNADKVLSQEEAFWQLTVKNGNVLAVRVLLSLLILGIDLAPILTKLTGRTPVHDIRAHAGDHLLLEQHQDETRRLLAQHRHETDVAVYQYARQADTDRQLHDLAQDTRLYEAQQLDGVQRNRSQRSAESRRAGHDGHADYLLYKARLESNLSKLRYHHWYTVQKQRLDDAYRRDAPARPDDGNRPGSRPGGKADAGERDYRLVSPQLAPDAALDEADAPADQPPEPPSPKDTPARFSEEAVPDPAAEDAAPEPDDVRPADEPGGEAWEVADILWGREEPQGALVLDNRWVLHRRLPGAESGGGGIVWQAKDRLDETQEWLVVKTVPSGVLDRELLKMLQRELRVAGVADKNIGEIKAHGDDRGFSYLVYPWYRPGSLGAYRKQRRAPLSLLWCARVIDEVLSGLERASAANLVHLDLKPGNIVLDGDHARIIDWGLSRRLDVTQPSTWVVKGTPFFACPEQLIRPQVGWDTPRADLYGVGATFYWLIAGEPPYQSWAAPYGDGQLLEVYRGMLVDRVRPQPVHELVARVPRELGQLIDQWMSFNPASRIPGGTPVRETARAARAELAALLPVLPDVPVGRVTGRRRGRPR